MYRLLGFTGSATSLANEYTVTRTVFCLLIFNVGGLALARIDDLTNAKPQQKGVL